MNLITEEGIKLYKGDKYYFIAKSWLGAEKEEIFENTIKDDISRVALQIFAEKRSAEEYIKLKHKIYSWEDIEKGIAMIQKSELTKNEFIKELKTYLENPKRFNENLS